MAELVDALRNWRRKDGLSTVPVRIRPHSQTSERMRYNMTPKQAENYNKMLFSLRTIIKYESLDALRRNAEKVYGLSYHDTLEMAYENIKQEAKIGARGVREI